MTQHEKSEKRPSGCLFPGIVLLIVLLLLIGTVGFLYYSAVKAPLDLDDPQKMAASEPMSPEDRFVFSADGTVQVKLDKGDLWNLILAHTGTDFLDIINKEISSYDLSVSGCAIHMDEEGLRLDLEVFFKDTRLVAKVPCDLEISGRHISLTPTGVKLGVLPLPVGSILSTVKLEYDMNLPVISDVTQVSFEKDAIILTGSVEQDIRTLVPLDKKLRQTAVFCESLKPLADALHTQEGFSAIASHLEQKPGAVEELYRELFTIANAQVTTEYLTSRFGLTQRFFPGIDFSVTAVEQAALDSQLTVLSNTLELFFTCAVNDYNEKNFHLYNGEFLKNGTPFHATQYGEECAALFETLDPESFFLILVDVEDGFIRKTSSFYRIADENQQFTQPVDFNKTYILGCVFRSVSGAPYLMYEAEIQINNTYSRSITLLPLTEEDVAQLRVPGVFGVYTD